MRVPVDRKRFRSQDRWGQALTLIRDSRAEPAVVRQSGRSVGSMVRSTRTELRFDPLLSFESWAALGARIGAHASASSWWLGDWLAFGQSKYGRRYKAAVATTGLDYQTLRNYAVVARRFEVSRRRADLTFQHHAEVCALADEDQERWLELAKRHRWSRNELRRRVRAAAAVALPAADGRIERVAVVVSSDRARRWQEAAESEGCQIGEWVIRSLDDAAGRAQARQVTPLRASTG